MSQVDWNNYTCRDFYDELLAAPGKPRASADELCNMLARFSAEELAERKTAAEIAIRTMGITFTVYSEGAMIDRAWPFDTWIHRITAALWTPRWRQEGQRRYPSRLTDQSEAEHGIPTADPDPTIPDPRPL